MSSKPHIRDAFAMEFGKFIFRRVKSIVTFAPKVYKVMGVDDTGEVKVMDTVSESNDHTLSREIIEQNTIELCSQYSFFVGGKTLRPNDTLEGITIKGVKPKKVDVVVDHLSTRVCGRAESEVMPRHNDLICGKVEKGEKGYFFSQWFICSDQFMRMWTAILYPECLALGERDDDEFVRRRLMSGNRLCTNSYLKYLNGCKDSRIEFELEERRKRYYALRTESPSIDYVHVYAALVLIIKYGEYPNEDNVPNNLNSDPKLLAWVLPYGFMEALHHNFDMYNGPRVLPTGEVPIDPVVSPTELLVVVEQTTV
jgi:hypothetical protein